MESKRTGNIRLLGIVYSIIVAVLTLIFGWYFKDDGISEIELVTFSMVIITLLMSLALFIFIIEMKEYKINSENWKHKHELKMVEIGKDVNYLKEMAQK